MHDSTTRAPRTCMTPARLSGRCKIRHPLHFYPSFRTHHTYPTFPTYPAYPTNPPCPPYPIHPTCAGPPRSMLVPSFWLVGPTRGHARLGQCRAVCRSFRLTCHQQPDDLGRLDALRGCGPVGRGPHHRSGSPHREVLGGAGRAPLSPSDLPSMPAVACPVSGHLPGYCRAAADGHVACRARSLP